MAVDVDSKSTRALNAAKTAMEAIEVCRTLYPDIPTFMEARLQLIRGTQDVLWFANAAGDAPK